MRLFIIILALLAISAPAALAQVPGLAPAPQAAQPAPDPAIEQLIQIIQNEQTRNLLINSLKQANAQAQAEPVPEAVPDLSIARQLAEYTRSIAEGASYTFRTLGALFSDLQHGLTGTLSADLTQVRDVAIGVLLVGGGLVAAFFLMRLIVLWMQAGIARRFAQRPWFAKLAATIGAA